MIKKKAQGGEMIGLLVIIILILVLVAFFFRFASKPKSNIQEESIISIQLNNFLQAYTKYTPCSSKTMVDVIVACSESKSICGYEDSCTLVKDESDNMLRTFFNKEYSRETIKMTIKNNDKELVSIPDIDLQCKHNIVEDKNIPLTDLNIKLVYCLS
ncbi:hypothetical protein D6777_01690 [Candidatus Woesearchaeota archaeon]|nr:MAG: hypothetical protein D6777_01690 [Candidatus Woesearchaeota archaeon]